MLSLVDNWIVFHFVSAYFAFTTVCTPFALYSIHCIAIAIAFAVCKKVRSPRSFAVCFFLVYFMFALFCILFCGSGFFFHSVLVRVHFWPSSATIFFRYCCKVVRKRDVSFFVRFYCSLWQTICELNCGHFDAYADADDVSYVISLSSHSERFLPHCIRPAKIIEWNLIICATVYQASTYSYSI